MTVAKLLTLIKIERIANIIVDENFISTPYLRFSG
jgi:hypothetical protein